MIDVLKFKIHFLEKKLCRTQFPCFFYFQLFKIVYLCGGLDNHCSHSIEEFCFMNILNSELK